MKVVHASDTLRASNSRLSLSVPLPTNSTSFQPGKPLRAVVQTHGGVYSSVSVRLVGKCGGLWRAENIWQVGPQEKGTSKQSQFSLAGESMTLVDVQMPLDETCSRAKVFAVVFPEMEGQILPSFDLGHHRSERWANVRIRYKVEIVAEREGSHLFRKHDRLSVEIPVTFPSDSSSETWSAQSTSTPLAFKGADGTRPLLQVTLVHEPLTIARSPLNFALSLAFPTSSTTRSLFTNPPIVTAHLTRRARTTLAAAVTDTNVWPAQHIADGEVEPTTNDGLRWEGEIDIPDGEMTIDGCTVGIEYTLVCTVHSKALEEPLVVQTAVHLPSAFEDVEVDDPLSDDTTESSHHCEPSPPAYRE